MGTRARARTGAGRFGVVMAAALTVMLTGCGGGGDRSDGSGGEGTRPSSTTPTASGTGGKGEGGTDEGGSAGRTPHPAETERPTSPGTSPTPSTTDTDTDTDTKACFDGRCTISVSKPRSIEVDGKFGVGELRVTKVTDDTVVLQSSGAGTFLSSSIGEGGTGGLNGLGFRVKSLEGGTAVLEFFPRA
ncbi:hypothetical protein [Streptomyces griseiscabiei]|uniref:Lipoprotein n=1 Tax=Streptomyces griseiscabiei TaxID=2993540 RepID=A0ABU4L5F1_9ACTN|nr:hypothetical protein [Streptomyces griseiscabiei]MBZ3901839.1 hypothetical protein [Streptomyces griseiscabiei]MDX2910961.1 hypothetical protein [Streptomyces griseiscabiei]